jgi:hypothetical protein
MNRTQSTFPKIALAGKLLAILSLVMVLVESKIPGMSSNVSLVSVRSDTLSFELVNFDVWVNHLKPLVTHFAYINRVLVSTTATEW